MKPVLEMNDIQFKYALSQKTTPQLILANCRNIYEYLSQLFDEDANDSILREWAFQWSSAILENDYDVIYNKWLEGPKKGFNPFYNYKVGA